MIRKIKSKLLGSAADGLYTDQVSSLMGTTILPSLQGRLLGLDIVRTVVHVRVKLNPVLLEPSLTLIALHWVKAYSDNTRNVLSPTMHRWW